MGKPNDSARSRRRRRYATIVLGHIDKELASKTWKQTYGYHPLLCFLDATGEALSALLRTRAGRVEHHRRSH